MGYWCARSFRALIALTLCYFNGKFEFDFSITYTLASFYSSIAFALPKKNMCMTCILKLGRHAESVEVGTQPYRIRCYPINMSTASNISLRFLVKFLFFFTKMQSHCCYESTNSNFYINIIMASWTF